MIDQVLSPTVDEVPCGADQREAVSVIGQELAHDSALLHVTGEAHYGDDQVEPVDLLYAAIGISRIAHGQLRAVDYGAICDADGVIAVLSAADIPGYNSYAASGSGDPLLADGIVEYYGQPVFAVAADSVEQARLAAGIDCIQYQVMPPSLTVDTARAAASKVMPSRYLSQGDPDNAIATAPHALEGHVAVGGQEHFYLEGQIATAIPLEAQQMRIYSSTQHPHQVQKTVARALGVADNLISVECRRIGGGFGGKESQAAWFACIAALLAQRTRRTVKLRLDRDDDILITGKRHDFLIGYHVGFDNQGRILGIKFELEARCGMSADLSGPVSDRAMLHCDNAYYLEHTSIASHRYKTNTQSSTAFRGFGGPQAMFGIEYVIDEIARYLALDPLGVRRTNFYHGAERNRTPYGQPINDPPLPLIVDELLQRADYHRRRAALQAFNASNPVLRKGLALTPVKFGIAFTHRMMNQAGVLLNVCTDGSVQLNHGGIEMGQGVAVKVIQVVAEELQIPLDRIRIMPTDTSIVPNASATAASSGADLNARAAQAAAATLKQRLLAVAADSFALPKEHLRLRAGRAYAGTQSMTFGELVDAAWRQRTPLSATGFYRTPGLNFDFDSMSGCPFYYFAYGAAVSEVVVDTLSGEHRVLRVDIVHDCGKSLNPAIDRGQIEGGFVQGMGWLTTEELWWDADGRLATHAPSTYKIPLCSDVPAEFNVQLFDAKTSDAPAIYRSKAVGEPPLMLALSVFFAIKDALASVSDSGHCPRFDAPASPQTVLSVLDAIRSA